MVKNLHSNGLLYSDWKLLDKVHILLLNILNEKWNLERIDGVSRCILSHSFFKLACTYTFTFTVSQSHSELVLSNYLRHWHFPFIFIVCLCNTFWSGIKLIEWSGFTWSWSSRWYAIWSTLGRCIHQECRHNMVWYMFYSPWSWQTYCCNFLTALQIQFLQLKYFVKGSTMKSLCSSIGCFLNYSEALLASSPAAFFFSRISLLMSHSASMFLKLTTVGSL